MNFFVTANGRSGTQWLSWVLGQGATHQVRHEVGRNVEHFTPFPIARWQRNSGGGRFYGEVNGRLRYHLVPGRRGAEAHVPARLLLFRSKRAIIRSWMNRDGRNRMDFGWTCWSIIRVEKHLLELADADRAYEELDLELLTTELRRLQRLIDRLELGFRARPKMLRTVINGNQRQWFEWDRKRLRQYDYLQRRYAHPRGRY